MAENKYNNIRVKEKLKILERIETVDKLMDTANLLFMLGEKGKWALEATRKDVNNPLHIPNQQDDCILKEECDDAIDIEYEVADVKDGVPEFSSCVGNSDSEACTGDGEILLRIENKSEFIVKPVVERDVIKVGVEVSEEECVRNPGPSEITMNSSAEFRRSDFIPRKKQRFCISTPSEADCKSIDETLLDMLILDCEPLELIERKGFRLYSKKLCPHYSPTLTKTMLTERYLLERSRIQAKLDTIDSIALSTDTWISSSNVKYLTVTAHFITDFKINSIALSTKEMDYDYMGDVLDAWKIRDKIVTIVTDDNESIKEAVVERLQKNHYVCVAHTLNSKMEKCINRNVEVLQLFARLKQDFPSRWRTVLITMQKWLDSRTSIENLEDDQWNVIIDCVNILQPFEKLVKEMLGENYRTLSSVIPLLRGVSSVLRSKRPTTQTGTSLKLKLLNVVDELKVLEFNDTVLLSTFLDPRFKNVKGEETVVQLIENASIHSDDLWGDFDKQAAGRVPVSPVVSEVKRYLELPQLDRNGDPLDFWRCHAGDFSGLSELAVKYLCIPATSIPAERVFAQFGCMVDPGRNRLDGRNLQEMLFLNSVMRNKFD